LQRELFGAIWIGKINSILPRKDSSFSIQGKMLKSLFVIHKMRGKGFGKMLLSKAVYTAKQKGACDICSLIHPDRKGSIFAHEAAGFILAGEIITKNILFNETTHFRTNAP